MVSLIAISKNNLQAEKSTLKRLVWRRALKKPPTQSKSGWHSSAVWRGRLLLLEWLRESEALVCFGNAEQLVVLRYAVGARERAGLDLPTAQANG